MSLNAFWSKRHLREAKPVITHWIITVWFFETVGSMAEDEFSDPDGRKACDFTRTKNTFIGTHIWHPRDWVDIELDGTEALAKKITCEACLALYKDIFPPPRPIRIEDITQISKAIGFTKKHK